VQTVQLAFPLRQPESFDWQRDPGFNSRVHRRLLAAHARILNATPAADCRPRIERDLLPLRATAMSQRQEMLLYYLLAQCARARDLTLSAHFCKALEWCARAESIAGALQDYGAQVDLHELRGTLHRTISIIRIAAEEFSYALRLMREHAADMESFDPEFEVTVAAKAAGLEYMLGDFSRALGHLQRAATLLPLTATSTTGLGTIAWIFALLHRQRNDPVEALWHVEVAAELYRQVGRINSTCRVLALAGDIAMDAAEMADTERAARERYLALAARYIEEAFHVGEEAADLPGLELARLSLARLDRLHGGADAASAEARIRATLRQARTIRDDALLTAAQTELGAELLARGQVSRGKSWLKKAIATAASMNAPGVAFRAQRLLRRANGRNA
jgi:tetratricopeptide (TPR) repeat protein